MKIEAMGTLPVWPEIVVRWADDPGRIIYAATIHEGRPFALHQNYREGVPIERQERQFRDLFNAAIEMKERAAADPSFVKFVESVTKTGG